MSIIQKLLFFIALLSSIFFCIFTSVSAIGETDSNNVASQNFIISTRTMDPLLGSHSNPSSTGLAGFQEILGNVTGVLLFTIPILAVVSMLIAGYLYIFSAGDSEKSGRAKNIIKWNIMAIMVALLSYGIVKIVASFFN